MASPLTVRVLPLHHLPETAVYARLGYRPGKTGPEAAASYGALIQRLTAETRVRVFHREAPIAVAGDAVDLDGYRFASRGVARRFAGAAAALVLGASALPEDAARRGALEAAGDLTQAVVLDAVLSEKVDFALDAVEQELAAAWRRLGRTLGRRLSCGYGDFSLEHQRYFHEALEFERYGIRLDERSVLHPEKTVTALLPIYAGEGDRHEV